MFWVSTTIAFTHDYRHGDVHLLPVPMFHVGGMSFATIFVHRGATLAPLPAWDPAAVLALIARERVNHFFAVPAMLRGLLDIPNFARADIASLRWILSGGAPVPVDLVEAFAEHGIPVLQTYGATETAGPATAVDVAHASSKAGSIGQPYFHTEVRIADARGREVEPNIVGELQIRGPHLMSGYWRDDTATAEAFVDGWFKTGDLGRRDADGYIYLVDRAKDMIITGGENVYSAEVETVLAKYPSIAEVAVVGIPDPKWGEAVCAVVVARAPMEPPTLVALRAFCEGKIARYKMPVRLVIRTDALPRNATGKVMKSGIRDWLGSA
jgi:fatty-acyl-CoA synthase